MRIGGDCSLGKRGGFSTGSAPAEEAKESAVANHLGVAAVQELESTGLPLEEYKQE